MFRELHGNIPPRTLEGMMKSILILDDDRDMCSMLEEFYSGHGVEKCTIVHSVKELKSIPPPYSYELALLDVNLGEDEPSGIDAYEWLMKNGFKGKSVFLSGHARSHHLIQKTLILPRTFFLEKPAKLKDLEKLIR